MMFTVTVRLKDGSFKEEKILLFKFLVMLSAPLHHPTPYSTLLVTSNGPRSPPFRHGILDVWSAFKGTQYSVLDV